MAVLCTLQVVLALWVLLPRSQVTSAADHPPVLDGKNLVFTCSRHSESTQRRSLFWMTTDPVGDSVNQATCHSTEPGCRNYHDKFVATASFTDKDYTTSLTIPALSNHAWFVTVNCTLYEKERDSSYVIKSWTMSDFVYTPENPVCTADYNFGEATVTISCSTTKVFPAIVCKFFEIHDNGKVVPLTSAEITYSYPESITTAYQCSMIKTISKTGIYKYKVDLYPGLADSDLLKGIATSVYTNEINVAGNPESMPHCKDNKRQGFESTSNWLPSQANLVCFENTTLISNTTTTTTHVDSGLIMSESSVELYDRDGNKVNSRQLLEDTNIPSLYLRILGYLWEIN